jgi:hypothetical protein
LVFPSAAIRTTRARSESRTASTRLRPTFSSQSRSSTLNSTFGAVRIYSSSIQPRRCHSYSWRRKGWSSGRKGRTTSIA